MTSGEPAVTRGAHIMAGILGELFYLPASLLALATGIVLGLGAQCGVVRHYWVLVKLVLTTALFAGGNLAVIPAFAAASDAAVRGEDVGDTAVMMVTAMSAGLTLLLVATLLSVFKPWGRTSRHPGRRRPSATTRAGP